MVLLGSLLATLSGILYSVAALLQKHQGMHVVPPRSSGRLLASLARRPVWLLSLGISALAWVAEAASFALAPLVTVAMLRNAGRGVLVIGGARWLKERFSAPELLGVLLSGVGGALAAIAGAHGPISRRPLSNFHQLVVAVICTCLALGVAWLSSGLRRKDHGANGAASSRGSGVLLGVAVGVLFAGTGVFTKEVADRVAMYGLAAVKSIAAAPAPWAMVAMAVWAQSLLQRAFQRTNAATASAAAAATSALGLLLAGFALYGEEPGPATFKALLAGGVCLAIFGTAMLVTARSAGPHEELGAQGPGPP